MNKNYTIVISMAICFTLVACSNVPEKEAADDFCNCTQQLEQKLSPTTVNIITECASAQNFDECLTNNMLSLDSAQAQILLTQDLPVMMSMEEENNDFNNCVKGIEKKYENKYSFDKEKTIRGVMEEMEKNDCKFGLSILKQALKDSIQ
jgi:hypothetical protein